jgi:hypothetical protein
MVADDTMLAGTVETQLVSLADKVSEIRTDVAVIRSNMTKIDDHEGRIRSLEATRSRLWAIWGGAVVLGAVASWILAYVTRVR